MNDKGHRPHADHWGETPKTQITYGPESIRVTLDAWGPSEGIFPAIYDALQANWGDAPSRIASRACDCSQDTAGFPLHATGWCKLTEGERAYVETCFSGNTLQQVLEGITFNFTIDGVTRAFTHQHVRTRVGAAFMQHGGRDNDWRHRPWTMPETIRRACEVFQGDEEPDLTVPGHCLDMPEQIENYLGNIDEGIGLRNVIAQHLDSAKTLYAALVDAGIPWQDARRVLPIGLQTYIHDVYNYVSLRGMLANRLELIMDWEINCVAQLMKREVIMKCPPIFGKYLQSHSDRARRAVFAGLESWPPDGKWPVDPQCVCGHAKANHQYIDKLAPDVICEACIRNRTSCPGYTPVEIPRTHCKEQNPFWILAPDSMAGGPITWIPTNGEFPDSAR
jgi:thymidylate synthase ThyX